MKIFRRALAAIVLLSIALLAATAVYLTAFLDLNDYRGELERLVKGRTGLTLEIQGDISHSFARQSELSVADVHLSAADGTIAVVDRLDLALELLPLVGLDLRISRLDAHLRELNLRRDREGRLNLAGTGPDSEHARNAPEPLRLPVDTVELRDITIEVADGAFHDAVSGNRAKIKDARLELSRLPVVADHRLVVDHPALVADYEYGGQISVAGVAINQTEVSDLNLAFDNAHGSIAINDFAARVQRTDTRGSASSLALSATGSSQIKIEFEPSGGGVEPSWRPPKSLMLGSAELQLPDLQFQAPSGQALGTKSVQLQVKNLPLVVNGSIVGQKGDLGAVHGSDGLLVSAVVGPLQAPLISASSLQATLKNANGKIALEGQAKQARATVSAGQDQAAANHTARFDLTAKGSLNVAEESQADGRSPRALTLESASVTVPELRLEHPDGTTSLSRALVLTATEVPLLVGGELPVTTAGLGTVLLGTTFKAGLTADSLDSPWAASGPINLSVDNANGRIKVAAKADKTTFAIDKASGGEHRHYEIALDVTGSADLEVGGGAGAAEATDALLDSLTLREATLQAPEIHVDQGRGEPIRGSKLRLDVNGLPLIAGGRWLGAGSDTDHVVANTTFDARLRADGIEAVGVEIKPLDVALHNAKGKIAVEAHSLKGSHGSELAFDLTGNAKLASRGGRRTAGSTFPLSNVTLEQIDLSIAQLELESAGLQAQGVKLRGGGFPVAVGGDIFGRSRRIDRILAVSTFELSASGDRAKLPDAQIEHFDLSVNNRRGQLDLDAAQLSVQMSLPATDRVGQMAASFDLSGTAKLATKPGPRQAPGFAAFESVELETGDFYSNLVRVSVPHEGEATIHGAALKASRLPLMVGSTLFDPLLQHHDSHLRDGMMLALQGKRFEYQQAKVESVAAEFTGKRGGVDLKRFKLTSLGSTIEGSGSLQLDRRPLAWSIQLEHPELAVGPLLSILDTKQQFEGTTDLDLRLSAVGLTQSEILSSLTGSVDLFGHDMTITGIDLDRALREFASTQRVGLLDVGAMAVAGPLGILVTKGNDYWTLKRGSYSSGTSKVPALSLAVNFDQGLAKLEDVAFSTTAHRVAFRGGIRLSNQSFEQFQVATVAPNGCANYREAVYGTLAKPQISKASVTVQSVVNPLLSIVTTATRTLDIQCLDPFYQGRVPAPPKQVKEFNKLLK